MALAGIIGGVNPFYTDPRAAIPAPPADPNALPMITTQGQQSQAAPPGQPMTPYNIPQIDPGQYATIPGAYPNQLGGRAPGPTTMPQATATDIAGTTTAMGPRTPEGTWNQMYKIAMAESGMRNVPTGILNPKTGLPASTASGYWQMTDPTWKDAQEYANIPQDERTARAMDADYDHQKRAAYALYQQRGTTPWLASQHVWGSNKYTDLQVPDEDKFNPSLGQVASKGGYDTAAADKNDLKDDQSDPLAQYRPDPAAAENQKRQLNNLMALAMVRGWALRPVAYDPAQVLRMSHIYGQPDTSIHIDSTIPKVQGPGALTAISPRGVPGALGRKGPQQEY